MKSADNIMCCVVMWLCCVVNRGELIEPCYSLGLFCKLFVQASIVPIHAFILLSSIQSVLYSEAFIVRCIYLLL